MELKEQIARAMYYQHISPECKWENEGQWFRDKYLDFADQIIALIPIVKLVKLTDEEVRQAVYTTYADFPTSYRIYKALRLKIRKDNPNVKFEEL